jgi:hypothetical protein
MRITGAFVACVSLLVFAAGCRSVAPIQTAKPGDPAGTGSLEAVRQALAGSWTLVSLDVVDAQGGQRKIKASGQLTYDAFGAMSIRAVIEDAKLRDTVVLDYQGRIVIDRVRKEFYPADLTTDRPVETSQIAPVSPEKVRRYELSGDSFVVTYLDKSSRPTAVTRWRRQKS